MPGRVCGSDGACISRDGPLAHIPAGTDLIVSQIDLLHHLGEGLPVVR